MYLGVFPLPLQGGMNSCWAKTLLGRRVTSSLRAVPLGRGEMAEERLSVCFTSALPLATSFIRKSGSLPCASSRVPLEVWFSGVDGVMPEKEEVTGFWKFLFAVLIHAQISRSVSCGWGTLADSSHFCLYLLIYKMGQSYFCLCLKFVENIM